MKENEEVLQVFIWKSNLWNSNDDVNLHLLEGQYFKYNYLYLKSAWPNLIFPIKNSNKNISLKIFLMINILAYNYML